MFKKTLKIVVAATVAGWVLFCLAVYVYPEPFFYHPTTVKADLDNARANDFPADEVTYAAADGTELYGWFVKPRNGRGVIVYFHGNSYNIEAFYHKLVPFIEAGYGAFIGEYRGFGGIKGRIDENGLSMDAQAAVKWLNAQGYKNSDLIIYGMSLGSYTATDVVYKLGADSPFAALVLEVPFDSMLEVVRQRIWPLFPFSLLVRDKYDNVARIKQIHVPVLVMAASNDKTVSPVCAENLFAAANHPKEMIVYRGAGHSELYNFRNWRTVLKWLETNEKTK